MSGKGKRVPTRKMDIASNIAMEFRPNLKYPAIMAQAYVDIATINANLRAGWASQMRVAVLTGIVLRSDTDCRGQHTGFQPAPSFTGNYHGIIS